MNKRQTTWVLRQSNNPKKPEPRRFQTIWVIQQELTVSMRYTMRLTPLTVLSNECTQCTCVGCGRRPYTCTWYFEPWMCGQRETAVVCNHNGLTTRMSSQITVIETWTNGKCHRHACSDVSTELTSRNISSLTSRPSV